MCSSLSQPSSRDLSGLSSLVCYVPGKKNISTEAKTWLSKRWDECIEEDIKRIKIKWSKKMKSTREAFAKDKMFLSNHIKNRVPSSGDPSLQSKSNQNENADTSTSTPGPEVHNTENPSKNFHTTKAPPARPTIINISGRPLTPGQISLLSKGPKHCPTTKDNYINVKADIKEFTRKINLREQFHDQSFIDTSLAKKKSNYTPHSSNKELIAITNLIPSANSRTITSTQKNDKLWNN